MPVANEQQTDSSDTVASTDRRADARVDELLRMVTSRLNDREPIWATYRLQFTAEQFRFDDARDIADYLADLGISHLYSSPCVKARHNSTHGYDIVDYTCLNPELGGAEGFVGLSKALADHGLSQILDIVPNHMSVGGDENAWWLDVLAHGPASRFATYFDIDWHPVKRELEEKVLLPILDDFYGNVLEAGRLQIELRDGSITLKCNDARLPLDPRTWSRVLSQRIESLADPNNEEDADTLELRSILTALQHIPERSDATPERIAERYRESIVIQGRLKSLVERSTQIADHLARNVATINGTVGSPETFDELDRLLDDQAFRLSHWKAGSDEMNYRRFFDVTELAAISMENYEVFETTNRLLFELLAAGQVSGVRVDHIDGLFDPQQYLWRLQWGYIRALGYDAFRQCADENADSRDWPELEPVFLQAMHASVGGPNPVELFQRDHDRSRSRDAQAVAVRRHGSRPPEQNQLPLLVLVEKILGADEPLPTDWPVHGTTGYDFANLVNGLFVRPQGLRELERSYSRFIDERVEFREIVYECKRLILDGPMQSELQLLANRLDRLSHRHRRSRDYTLQALRSALREIIACFPVYRSYIHDGIVSDRDRRVIQVAVAQARRRNPAMDASLFEFIRDVLLLEQPPDLSDEGIVERDFFVGRFQQVTSPVMAKGVEDTAFYRYLPLASCNEVGAEPAHPVKTLEDFHHQNEARNRDWPQTLLATTTHDTKRSEDVRARIDVLSEIPGDWRSAVQRWTRWNRKHRREVDGQPAPSRNDEWLFYQTLLGVWPLTPPGDEEVAQLTSRLQHYMEKAIREAKLQTSWISPNAPYDAAVADFVANVLADRDSRFLQDVQTLHERIVNAGLYTALSQTLLKLTAPGVPDIYQGQEIWDFSLVDPDNRRRVDYAYRRQLLADIRSRTSTRESTLELARVLGANPRDSRTKLFVVSKALEYRRRCSEGGHGSQYVALDVHGERSDHLCAFGLSNGSGAEYSSIVIAPRLLATLSGDRPPLGPEIWNDTSIAIPHTAANTFRNELTGETVMLNDDRLMLADVLKNFPVALLVSDK